MGADKRGVRRREVHLADERSAGSARRRVAYLYPGVRVVKTRRVDPMTPARGFVVTVEEVSS